MVAAGRGGGGAVFASVVVLSWVACVSFVRSCAIPSGGAAVVEELCP
jgi:hypothetical protein